MLRFNSNVSNSRLQRIGASASTSPRGSIAASATVVNTKSATTGESRTNPSEDNLEQWMTKLVTEIVKSLTEACFYIFPLLLASNKPIHVQFLSQVSRPCPLPAACISTQLKSPCLFNHKLTQLVETQELTIAMTIIGHQRILMGCKNCLNQKNIFESVVFSVTEQFTIGDSRGTQAELDLV
ncbi:hypothetical protein LINPERHAP2_LOCUS19687, partial [Linum perenne]